MHEAKALLPPEEDLKRLIDNSNGGGTEISVQTFLS